MVYIEFTNGLNNLFIYYSMVYIGLISLLLLYSIYIDFMIDLRNKKFSLNKYESNITNVYVRNS